MQEKQVVMMSNNSKNSENNYEINVEQDLNGHKIQKIYTEQCSKTV